jgi:integrase
MFTAWCTEAGRRDIPATAETVAAFVDAMARIKAPATVRRYVSSVSTFHQQANVPNPCKALVVKYALKRMHRELGSAQRQARPINDRIVVRMLEAAGRRVRDLRDKALLVTAYTTMCRRAELVALQFADLATEADGFGTVAIRRSKTDQEGHGDVGAITPDAMVHLRAWIDAARIEAGPLFRSVRKGARIGAALQPGEVAVIFKRMASRARLSAKETAGISGHSTRVGAAQDMVRHDISMAGIMQAGRWKGAEMVGRYTRELSVRRGAVAKLAERREQFA